MALVWLYLFPLNHCRGGGGAFTLIVAKVARSLFDFVAVWRSLSLAVGVYLFRVHPWRWCGSGGSLGGGVPRSPNCRRCGGLAVWFPLIVPKVARCILPISWLWLSSVPRSPEWRGGGLRLVAWVCCSSSPIGGGGVALVVSGSTSSASIRAEVSRVSKVWRSGGGSIRFRGGLGSLAWVVWLYLFPFIIAEVSRWRSGEAGAVALRLVLSGSGWLYLLPFIIAEVSSLSRVWGWWRWGFR